MSKTLDQQMKEVFGENYNDAPEAINNELDARLEADLISIDGFSPGPYVDTVKMFLSELTHSQKALIITALIASESECPVGNVVFIKSLEAVLAARLVVTAAGANLPVEPILEASLNNILAHVEQN